MRRRPVRRPPRARVERTVLEIPSRRTLHRPAKRKQHALSQVSDHNRQPSRTLQESAQFIRTERERWTRVVTAWELSRIDDTRPADGESAAWVIDCVPTGLERSAAQLNRPV